MSEAKLDLILQQLGNINGKIDKLDGRMNSLEERMDRIEERMDRFEERMDRIEERMDRMEDRMTRMENRAESHEALTLQLIQMVADNNKKWDSLYEIRTEVVEVKEQSVLQFGKTERHIRSLEDDLQKTIYRVELLEKLQQK